MHNGIETEIQLLLCIVFTHSDEHLNWLQKETRVW
jgi:hypothetical protein